MFRYPIKGFNPQKLNSVTLSKGETFPWDRAYAFENGPAGFDPENPEYFPKMKFLMLMRNEKLAELQADYDETQMTITIRCGGKIMVKAPLGSAVGLSQIESFIADYMGDDLQGPPRLLSAPGHSFSDMTAKCVHIVNLQSIRELEMRTECPLDPIRFRANIYLDGASPWAEKQWPGKTLKIGGAMLDVFSETTRCAATNVDPATAKRDMQIPRELLQSYNHTEFGVYAKVTQCGTIGLGDRVELVAG